jgi:hypothetical protein
MERRSQRFAYSISAEDAEVQMALAEYMRTHDGRAEWGGNCEHPCWGGKKWTKLMNDTKGNSYHVDVEHFKECTICRNIVEKPVHGKLEGKQLFMDTYLVHSVSNAQRVLEDPMDDTLLFSHQGEKPKRTEGNDVIKGDGEGQCGTGPGFPGSVLHDGTQFVMYYHHSNHLVTGRGTFMKKAGLIRATSKDGVTWYDKQEIRIAVNCGKDMCVLYDTSETDPRFRYKMIIDSGNELNKPALAVSADGIVWDQKEMNESMGFPGYSDTTPCLYHDSPTGEYHFVSRQQFWTPRFYREIRGAVTQSGSLDMSKKKPVWTPNVTNEFYFDMDSKDERYRRHLYSLTRTRYAEANIYFGIAQMYEWPTIYSKLGNTIDKIEKVVKSLPVGNAKAKERLVKSIDDEGDALRLYLVTSRDGIHFDLDWIYAGQRWMRKRQCGSEIPAAQILTINGAHHVYYECRKGVHDEASKHGKQGQNGRWGFPAEVYLARFVQDRMVGWKPSGGRSDDSRAILATNSFVYDGELLVNAKAETPGSTPSSLTVELLSTVLGSPSRKLVSVDLDLTSTTTWVPVVWGCQDPKTERFGCASAGNVRVHLRFSWTLAVLYGFQMKGASPPSFSAANTRGNANTFAAGPEESAGAITAP